MLCPPIGICDSNTGKDPSLVDIQPTAVFAENLKSHIEPPAYQSEEGSAGTGHSAKSSRFERDKFTGYFDAPFVDALTGDRTI